ncbi:hypothetical protein E2C01_094119 [Portunus trituberculatus]|uniref:Uncharacterized protein n=1 Tax=Portunus trituberculatus TaxID=210409 RepID=A0A5B7K0R4_PORTR|nr:hypothetical protein [Portunus trituberculatus]
MGEDETVEHVMLEDERVEKTGREWMVLLLGVCRWTSESMIEAVKEYLERMWRARSWRSKGWLRSDPEPPKASRSR